MGPTFRAARDADESQTRMKRAADDRSGKAIAYHWASRVISICMEMVLPGLAGYWLDQRLSCLAVCDLGRTSLSAVYTFYDPDFRIESMGTYSILKQVEFCQRQNLRYLYLGYYVAGSPHMMYKSRFLPNERLIDGRWEKFQ